ISFIDQLPNELLTLIFFFGSRLPHLQVRLKYPDSAVPPIRSPTFIETAIKTCRRWRLLIECTPSLWTNILITRSRGWSGRYYRLHPIDDQVSISSLTSALQRSSNLLLDTTVDFTYVLNKTIIQELVSESRRWRSLSILVRSSQDLPAALSHFKNLHTPELQTLEITAHIPRDGEYSYSSPPSFIESAPRLSTVRLNRVGLRWGASTLLNLTTLELRFVVFPSYSELQALFMNCPRLHTLKLHLDDSFTRSNENHIPDTMALPLIKIRCLRTLELRFFFHSSSVIPNMTKPLRIFSTPVLEELILKDCGITEWCQSLMYFRYHARAYPKLVRLILDGVKKLIYVDSSVVKAFPHLTSLHLKGLYASAFCRLLCNRRIQDLGWAGQTSFSIEVWPSLEELIIEKDQERKVEVIAKMTRARRQMGWPLRVIQLD
ncbi:hypothetical protein EV361DRAFT_811383, partial [Lentinula raphanica]